MGAVPIVEVQLTVGQRAGATCTQGNWGSLTPAKLEQQLEHWLANTARIRSARPSCLTGWPSFVCSGRVECIIILGTIESTFVIV